MHDSDWSPPTYEISSDRELIGDELSTGLLKVTKAGEHYIELWVGHGHKCCVQWLSAQEALQYYLESSKCEGYMAMLENGGGIWLNTEEHGLPEANQILLLANSNGDVQAGYHDGTDFLIQVNNSIAKNITHWRFLPAPPFKD